MGLAIGFGIVVVILAFSGQWWIAVPLMLVGAIIANRMGRRDAKR